jgi:hypothetical protein
MCVDATARAASVNAAFRAALADSYGEVLGADEIA